MRRTLVGSRLGDIEHDERNHFRRARGGPRKRRRKEASTAGSGSARHLPSHASVAPRPPRALRALWGLGPRGRRAPRPRPHARTPRAVVPRHPRIRRDRFSADASSLGTALPPPPPPAPRHGVLHLVRLLEGGSPRAPRGEARGDARQVRGGGGEARGGGARRGGDSRGAARAPSRKRHPRRADRRRPRRAVRPHAPRRGQGRSPRLCQSAPGRGRPRGEGLEAFRRTLRTQQEQEQEQGRDPPRGDVVRLLARRSRRRRRRPGIGGRRRRRGVGRGAGKARPERRDVRARVRRGGFSRPTRRRRGGVVGGSETFRRVFFGRHPRPPGRRLRRRRLRRALRDFAGRADGGDRGGRAGAALGRRNGSTKRVRSRTEDALRRRKPNKPRPRPRPKPKRGKGRRLPREREEDSFKLGSQRIIAPPGLGLLRTRRPLGDSRGAAP